MQDADSRALHQRTLPEETGIDAWQRTTRLGHHVHLHGYYTRPHVNIVEENGRGCHLQLGQSV